MALGSRGFKDFGLSSNMTLPMVAIEPDPVTSPLTQGAFMPEEKRGKKKHATFALDQEQVAPEDRDRGTKVKRTASWAHRLKGIFKRSKKRDRMAPYAVTPIASSPHAKEETEKDKQVKIMRTESDPELSASKRDEGKESSEKKQDDDGAEEQEKSRPRKRQLKSKNPDRKTKAHSTAFEHMTQEPIPAESVHVVFKSKSSSKSTRKVVLQHQEDAEDGFGLHLSGGLPPVTVTYVKPGSQAEEVGLRLGDVILEVNGLNCRKKVDITRLMELKMLVQQSPAERHSEQEHIDEAAWNKIKARQDELDSETSTNKITSLDSSSDEEPSTSPPVPVPKETKKVKKRLSSTRASGGDLGEPLATSSPLRDETAEKDSKPSKKRKTSSRSSIVNEDSKGKDGGGSSITEGESKTKASPKKSASLPVATEGTAKTKTSPDTKVSKRSPKKSATSPTNPGAEESKSKISPKKRKKRTSKLSEEPSVDQDYTEKQLQDVKVVQADFNDTAQEESRKRVEKSPGTPSLDEVDSSHPLDPGINRNDRGRRSNSPKSRYRMGEGEGGPELMAEQLEPEKVPVVKKKKKRKADVKRNEDKTKKETKKSKSKSQASEKKKEPKKRKKSKDEPASAEVPVATEPEPSPPPEAPITEQPVEILQSAAVSGSIESNTLTFVAAKKGSKSSLDKLTTEEQEIQSANTLPRRKSEDHGKLRKLSNSKPMNHSTSYSDLKAETQKTFREELREASRSQHDMEEAVDASITIDIDPNIKVKKSGLIKEGKGKGKALRPSIFDQSSSPELEVATPISSGAVEDNILDSEFKVKKSGLMVGRKTSSSTRPSILNEQSKESPHDIQPGEMKYNRKVSKAVDISVIPQISPSLGLVEGRDRLGAKNRSLTKRRPPSLRQNSTEGERMGTERVDLSQDRNGTPVRSATITDKAFPSMGSQGTSRTAAARKLFESKQPERNEAGKSFTKSVEQPVKMLGVSPATKTGEDKKMSEPTASPRPRSQTTVNGEKSKADTPSWISLAQGRQKRASMIEEKQPTVNTSVVAKAVSSAQTSSVPEIGHVAKRLAMFQKN